MSQSGNVGASIDPVEFDFVSNKVREFFRGRGFCEAHTQSILSILSSCEDPQNLTSFEYVGQVWPMKQTGQMELEALYLRDPAKYPHGLFGLATSYRAEPNPIPGRHDRIFPMAEFELPGKMEDMMALEADLCRFLGFKEPNLELPENSLVRIVNGFPTADYGDICTLYGVDELEHEHEERLRRDYGEVFFLCNFPESTDPFFNMGRYPEGHPKHGLARKVDVIINGKETFGSAERSVDPEQMRRDFHRTANGTFASTLYSRFGKDRVDKELNEFLNHNFVARSGAGMGLTRLISAMRNNGLIKK